MVSHRSAAALFGLGNLPANRYEFTLPRRRQSRRADVRIHVRDLSSSEEVIHLGLPATRPTRIASDLLVTNEDPEAVAEIVAEGIREGFAYPGAFARSFAPQAAQFGLRKGDGLGLFRWLVEMEGGPDAARWIAEAKVNVGRSVARDGSAV